jgi:hypothetical protein
MLRASLLACGVLVAACHPPPSELADAKRVVVVVGAPSSEGALLDRERYEPMTFEQLDAATCAAACSTVATGSEKLTACFRLSNNSFGGSVDQPAKRSHPPAEPSSLHVCTVE